MTSRVRTVAALAAVAWVGAVALFGAVVAPAAFEVLPTRALAGALVGRVLSILFLTGIAIGLLLAVASRAMGPGGARTAVLVAGVITALASGVAQFVIGARIEVVRESAGMALDELPPGHPTRVTFGRLHGLSVAGLGVATLGACGALALLLRRDASDRS